MATDGGLPATMYADLCDDCAEHALAAAFGSYLDAEEERANAVPLGAVFHGGGLDDTPRYDVIMYGVRQMRDAFRIDTPRGQTPSADAREE